MFKGVPPESCNPGHAGSVTVRLRKQPASRGKSPIDSSLRTVPVPRHPSDERGSFIHRKERSTSAGVLAFPLCSCDGYRPLAGSVPGDGLFGARPGNAWGRTPSGTDPASAVVLMAGRSFLEAGPCPAPGNKRSAKAKTHAALIWGPAVFRDSLDLWGYSSLSRDRRRGSCVTAVPGDGSLVLTRGMHGDGPLRGPTPRLPRCLWRGAHPLKQCRVTGSILSGSKKTLESRNDPFDNVNCSVKGQSPLNRNTRGGRVFF